MALRSAAAERPFASVWREFDLVPSRDYTTCVRVIAVSNLKEFWRRWPDAELPLRTWLDAAHGAHWAKPTDITAQFAAASVLQSRRVVFNIRGNDYRLVVAVAYRFGAVYVKFIGTHAEYDRVDADTVEIP